MSVAKVAFIGLGNMGGFMAANLLKAGHAVNAFDLSAAACETAEKHGATLFSSADAAAAADADVIVTMLPSSPHVEAVYGSGTGDGLIANAKEGALLIDCSTIDPDMSRKVSSLAAAAGKNLRMIDAPVSGGVGGAEAGTLTFMVGGEVDAVQAADDVLRIMGANIVHCGSAGAGGVAKICNNLVLGVSMLGVSEAMNLGEQQGIDVKVLADVINTSTGRCWSSDTYNPCPGVEMEGVPSTRGYSGGFGSALMLKDLGLAQDAARSVGAPLPMASLCASMYQLQVAQGNGLLDFSSMFALLKGQNNEKK